MGDTAWFLVIGLLLTAMAFAGSVLKRAPLSAAMFYLAAGCAVGPAGAGMLDPRFPAGAAAVERVAEVAVLVSLFTAGLKLRVPPGDRRWLLPLRLAVVSMGATVGLVALVGVYLLGLPVGAAVLLGAVLAPTDPVLAADVQVADAWDDDRVRFALTGEAGLNDGTAFPFVMLGLGLLGLHDLGAGGWRWLAVDAAWAVAGGLAVGWALGTGAGRLVLHLRRRHREAVGLDDFLTLGLIALAFGVADLIRAYGFLAVFAAGVALRRVEMRESGGASREELRERRRAVDEEDQATDPRTAPAHLARTVLRFNGHIERIGEVAVVLVLGALLSSATLAPAGWWLVPLLFLVVRPVATSAGLIGSGLRGPQRALVGWFGVRGAGSVYYLAFAVTHGLPGPLAAELVGLTLTVVAASVVLHGVSVTPLMTLYGRVRRRDRSPARPARRDATRRGRPPPGA
ncbi:sodium:proton antiporter : Sodium/proton antiporter, CPA1 family OS=Dechloromonas aromatica (strain RCB) GN=Daro_2072 PE=4 SV=1: Na_H_Exchanger [Gemmataceae bacterium]|nr:sodium:proton antiporter : Sodium/proton antiporter, CPA1 family OS=Dechloromonas aromatica (strain RCB) GN=Daro_2072 PE=4 SV=1: Na_H_Exchanger [Gemmataceae bacterium]VTU00903.1 sodium:proton antiporter : Sodium/proton antiporter, CPA1 family OS=Dechloromonas aromatica (strain RCB) GN=Daro_2072 PE=4 SV=1: Na_H_Exchanger [Gemmataceae bacterium]